MCITIPWRELLSRHISKTHTQRFWPGTQRSILLNNRCFRYKQLTDLEKPQFIGNGRKFPKQILIMLYSVKKSYDSNVLQLLKEPSGGTSVGTGEVRGVMS